MSLRRTQNGCLTSFSSGGFGQLSLLTISHLLLFFCPTRVRCDIVGIKYVLKLKMDGKFRDVNVVLNQAKEFEAAIHVMEHENSCMFISPNERCGGFGLAYNSIEECLEPAEDTILLRLNPAEDWYLCKMKFPSAAIKEKCMEFITSKSEQVYKDDSCEEFSVSENRVFFLDYLEYLQRTS